jgi:hypothetical protein
MSQDQQPTESVDFFLQLLTDIVNKSDSEIGVTLSVGGNLISGLLVSRSKYFEAFGTEFASAFHELPDVAANLYSSFSQLGDTYTQSSNPDQPPPPVIYIHLKNAKHFYGNAAPIPSNRGVWWRGRLSSIDGFSLGNLGPPA